MEKYLDTQNKNSLLTSLGKKICINEQSLRFECNTANDFKNWRDFLKIYKISLLLKQGLGNVFADFFFSLETRDDKEYLNIDIFIKDKKINILNIEFNNNIDVICDKIMQKINNNIKIFLQNLNQHSSLFQPLEINQPDHENYYTFLAMIAGVLIFLQVFEFLLQ